MNSLKAIYYTLRFWTLTTFLSIALGSVSIIGGVVDRSGNFSHRMASLWCRLACVLNGIRVEIKGLENIQLDKAQLFVANHQSYFDIFALSGYLPVQIRWMAKSILFHIPFVGWSMRAAGYISVDRKNRKESYKSFLKAIEKLKSGFSVVIFPEGTRSMDDQMGPFKKGGHLLAVRSQTPMTPVTIIGSGPIIRKGSGVIHPGPVRIIISPPIYPKDFQGKDKDSILNNIRDLIKKNLEEYNNLDER